MTRVWIMRSTVARNLTALPVTATVLAAAWLLLSPGFGRADEQVGPKDLPEREIQSWKAAGAESGYLATRDDPTRWAFYPGRREHAPKGALPAFRIESWKPRLLANLPRPAESFGLVLREVELSDVDMKDLETFRSLQRLEL